MAEDRSDENPRAFLIREHFKTMQFEKWDWNRIARLCKSINCHPDELFAMAAVSKRRADSFIAQAKNGGKLPTELLLHFANIERFHGERVFETASLPNPQEIEVALLLAR